MSYNGLIKKVAHTFSNYSKAINLTLCARKTKIKVIISRKINLCQQKKICLFMFEPSDVHSCLFHTITIKDEDPANMSLRALCWLFVGTLG